MGKATKVYRISSGNVKGRDHSEDLGVDLILGNCEIDSSGSG